MKNETVEGKLDWDAAEKRLLYCARVYAGLGSPGNLVLLYTILPLWQRFNSGERTQKLYDSIMAIAL